MNRHAFAALALALAATLLAAPALADESNSPSVKAAFVYNFIKLVAWPDSRFESERSPVRVCVLNGDGMLAAFQETIAGKAAGSHPIEVNGVTPAEGLARCHVLYLGNHGASSYRSLMAQVAGKGVLVVDEGAGFTWPDGMIRLFVEDKRMRFELNLEAMERSNLKVDPRLIRLARIATR